MAGLEVRAIDNSWIKAIPIPGSILINVGDLLEIYRFARYESITAAALTVGQKI